MNRVTTVVLFLLIQTVAFPQDKAGIESFACSIQRRMSCKEQCSSADGRIFVDRVHKRICYDYDTPFHYRFILSDTDFYGLDKKKKTGYVAQGTVSMPLARSVDVLEPFFTYAFGFNFGKQKVLASKDSCILYEVRYKDIRDIVAVHRDWNMPVIIESFGPNENLLMQMKITYDKVMDEKYVPRRIVIRKLCDTLLIIDTVILSRCTYNKPVRNDVFSIDPGYAVRRLEPPHDRMENPVLPISNEQQGEQHGKP